MLVHVSHPMLRTALSVAAKQDEEEGWVVPTVCLPWLPRCRVRGRSWDAMDKWVCGHTGADRSHPVDALMSLFSMTMWMHLHHGDEGLGTFLTRVRPKHTAASTLYATY